MDNVEREITKLGVEMGTIRECLVELQSWMRRKDEEEVGRAEMQSAENIQSHQEENPNGASGSGNGGPSRSEMGGGSWKCPYFPVKIYTDGSLELSVTLISTGYQRKES